MKNLPFVHYLPPRGVPTATFYDRNVLPTVTLGPGPKACQEAFGRHHHPLVVTQHSPLLAGFGPNFAHLAVAPGHLQIP